MREIRRQAHSSAEQPQENEGEPQFRSDEMLDIQEVCSYKTQDHLNPPHGGELVNLLAAPERISELQLKSRNWASWDLTARQLCDLDLLMNGGFSPLRGFTSRVDFYGPYDAQELLRAHEQELGITMVPFHMMVYLEERDTYVPEDQVPNGERTLTISGTKLRQLLSEGREIPAWFKFPDVVDELRRSYPPRTPSSPTCSSGSWLQARGLSRL
jgi:ATP sulfurylase